MSWNAFIANEYERGRERERGSLAEFIDEIVDVLQAIGMSDGECGRVYHPAKRGSDGCHHDNALGHKCKSNIKSPRWQVKEMLTDEETTNHVQHIGCEEMAVKLIEAYDSDVDMV